MIIYQNLFVLRQLEASTDYDERRKIRARLRQVMADQEGIWHLS